MIRDKLSSGFLVLVGIGGLLPLGATLWWGFELFSHFRLQYLLVAVALFFIAISVRKPAIALLLAVSIVLNGWPLLRYLPTASELESAFQLTVLNINVNAGNTDYAEIVESIRAQDSDLVAIVELTPMLEQAMLDLDDRYPFRYSEPDTGNFGIGILSRHPLISPQTFSTGPTVGIDTIVELPVGMLRFVAVHVYPPIGKAMAQTRNNQLIRVAEYVREIEGPLLLCGDFNLTPYSPYFGRLEDAADLYDVRRGQGFGFSWPSFMPLAGIPIDHCLIRAPVMVNSVERLAQFGSDHYPVRVSLGWQNRE